MKSAADLGRADRFRKTKTFKRAVRQTRQERQTTRQIARSGGDFPTKTVAAGVGGAVDAALSGKVTAGAVKLAGKGTGKLLQGVLFAPVTAAHLAGVGKPVSKTVQAAGREIVDIPANTIPSVYSLGKTTAEKGLGAGAKALAEPFVETAKHPGKAITEHPVSTTLMAAGGPRGLDLSLGKVERTLTRTTPTRPEARVPGTALKEIRPAHKGAVARRVQARKDKARGPATMTEQQVKRRVDETVAANEDIRRLHRGQTVQAAQEALAPKTGRKVVRKHSKPTEATTLIAQNIVKPTKQDLLAYHSELEQAAQGLKGAKARANRQTRKAIRQSIKKFDAGHQEVAARRYAELSRQQQDALVERGLLSKDQAEKARLLPYATRVMGNPDATIPQIRAHMAAHNVSEPAFITHAPNQRGARNFYVPQHEPPSMPKAKRTGTAVRQGTLDIHPDVMVEQAARSQGLVDAADSYARFVKEFSVRDPANRAQPHQFRTYQQARKAASDAHLDAHGDPIPGAVTMRPVRLAPFLAKRQQLEALLKAADDPTAHQQALSHIDDAIKDALSGSPSEHGPWALVPEAAAKRMLEHVGTGSSQGAKVAQAYGGLFRKNVLAFSPKWLTGNVGEAELRSAIARAGPRSYVTGRKVLRRLQQIDPQAAEQLRVRATGGGHYSLGARVNLHRGAEQFAGAHPAIRQVANVLGKAGRTPGPKHAVQLHRAITDFVMNSLNGRYETNVQTRMLGKALRDSPLMDGHTVKMSNRAVEQAAQGLRGTAEQVQLGRAVDRMYGRYGKFSPSTRRLIAGYTPFIAWTRNALEFLGKVLPADHPVLTAALASASQASEEWRKDKGLAFGIEGAVPGFLMGSIPGKDGSHLRLARYTPTGLWANEGGPLASATDLLLPQFSGMIANARGEDWRGRKLAGERKPQEAGRNALAVATTFLENLIPLSGAAENIAGVKPPNVPKSEKVKGTTASRARARFDPFMYTQASGGTGGSAAKPGIIVLPKQGTGPTVGKIVLPPNF